MTLTKNTLRFWLLNRLVWLSVALLMWMQFCSHFTSFKELWALMFCGGCGILVLAMVYVTEHPASTEWLMMRKWMCLLLGKDALTDTTDFED